MSLIKSITYGIDVYNKDTMSFTIPLNSRVLISGFDPDERRELSKYIQSKFSNNSTHVVEIHSFNDATCDVLIKSFENYDNKSCHIIIVDNIYQYNKLFPYMDYIFYFPYNNVSDEYFFSEMIKTNVSGVYSVGKFIDNIKNNKVYHGKDTYMCIKVSENEKSKSAKIQPSNNETPKIETSEMSKCVEPESIPTPGELKELSKYIEFKNEFIISMKKAATNGETQYNKKYAHDLHRNYINKLSEELKNAGHDVKYNDAFICVFW